MSDFVGESRVGLVDGVPCVSRGRDEAIEEFRAVLAERKTFSGPDHPHTLSTRHNLARQFGLDGQLEVAIAVYRSTLLDHERALGPDNPQTLRARRHLAFWLGKAGKDTALDESMAVRDDCIRVLGPNNPETLTAERNLARLRGRSTTSDAAIGAAEPPPVDRDPVADSDQVDN